MRDANALNVGAFSNGTTGNVLFSAGGVLTMPFGINIATTGDIALISGGAFTQQSTLSGANIALQSNGPMTLSQNITASGTLTLNDIATGGGGINQTAGAIVAAGLTTVNASSSGNITLNQSGNDFGTIAAAGGSVALTDANFVTLGTITANGPVSVTAPSGIDLSNNVTFFYLVFGFFAASMLMMYVLVRSARAMLSPTMCPSTSTTGPPQSAASIVRSLWTALG